FAWCLPAFPTSVIGMLACASCGVPLQVEDRHDLCPKYLGVGHLREALTDPCMNCSILPLPVRENRLRQVENLLFAAELPPSGMPQPCSGRRWDAPAEGRRSPWRGHRSAVGSPARPLKLWVVAAGPWDPLYGNVSWVVSVPPITETGGSMGPPTGGAMGPPAPQPRRRDVRDPRRQFRTAASAQFAQWSRALVGAWRQPRVERAPPRGALAGPDRRRRPPQRPKQTAEGGLRAAGRRWGGFHNGTWPFGKPTAGMRGC
ncbi:hypothetical protein GOODEAATRI_018773, partial [Goodea atripinnis]